MPDTNKQLYRLSPRDWREHDEVVAQSPLGTVLIANRTTPAVASDGEGGAGPGRRRLVVEIDGDPADPGVRDAIFYALGIGRPSG